MKMLLMAGGCEATQMLENVKSAKQPASRRIVSSRLMPQNSRSRLLSSAQLP
jgi:hypothetical protein